MEFITPAAEKKRNLIGHLHSMGDYLISGIFICIVQIMIVVKVFVMDVPVKNVILLHRVFIRIFKSRAVETMKRLVFYGFIFRKIREIEDVFIIICSKNV